tara:strand:- start:605 stop:1576 length:972 start_codon:yes stop_codon:yes gene_type:complete
MFQFQPAISEGDALKSRIDSKSTDSIAEQPENTDVVELSQDAPTEDANEPEAQANEEIAAEVEDSEANEESQTEQTDTDEDLYVEYKGREINLRDVEEWEQGSLRQSDYTRKTQAHADEVKAFEAKQGDFNAKASELDSKLAQLNAIINEDTPSADELAEWREYEPEKLLDYQEKQAKRKELLESSKGFAPTNTVDVQAEQTKLWGANPSWTDNGKQTKAFTDDMALTQSYALKNGYSNDELSGLTSAHHLQTLINAAKYEKIKSGNAAIEKKVRKAPVSTRPKAQTKSHITTDIAALEKKVRQTGNEADFVKLRQLKRQLTK